MIIAVKPEWRRTATQAAEHKVYENVLRRERLVPGFIAELAVRELLRQADNLRGCVWLSILPGPRVIHGPHPRHIGDLLWGTTEIDVKLLSKHQRQLQIKYGAEHLPHVFVEWFRVTESLRVLGFLLAPAPETFNEPKVLQHDGTQVDFTRLHHQNKPVRGWDIPRSRLIPITEITRLL